jgi:hypothetical protein
MSCNWTDPATCVPAILGGATSDAVAPAWDAICRSFADAAAALLQAFAQAFARLPDLSPGVSGIASPYGISLVIGSVIASLLVFGQVIRTLWTRDGTPMARRWPRRSPGQPERCWHGC